MNFIGKRCVNFIKLVIFTFVLCLSLTRISFADIYVNILAVNGTDQERSTEVHEEMPSGLLKEDIIDTDGLQISYDAEKGVYYVHGEVSLGPKETRTYKVLIRDIWQVDEEEIKEIKSEIDASLERIQGTEYYDIGKIKKESLVKRLDYIQSQQEEFADDIEKRISRFNTYAEELKDIRISALSVKYWRSRPPTADEAAIISMIIEVENINKVRALSTASKRHYLPSEVKPEHFIDLQGFEIFYDALKKKSYLKKDEELQPSEIKRYVLGIIDVWNIAQKDVDDIKDRARKTYTLLEKTEYVESAGVLMASIKSNLEAIEESQTEERPIHEHIRAYRKNVKRYEKAEKDVRTLEEMLEAVRETLERSKLKNVLKKIKDLKSIVEIAKSIFKRPQINTAWKIILGIVIFVGLFTTVHYIFWGRKLSESKKKDEEEGSEEQR